MQRFNNIATIFLAGLLFMSSIGVTMNKHYCLGRLKNVAVFEKAMNCSGEIDKDEDCAGHCCKEVQEDLQIKELQKVDFALDLSPELFLLSVLIHPEVTFEFNNTERSNPKFKDYSPPPIEEDIPVLIQSFLI